MKFKSNRRDGFCYNCHYNPHITREIFDDRHCKEVLASMHDAGEDPFIWTDDMVLEQSYIPSRDSASSICRAWRPIGWKGGEKDGKE